MKKLFKYLMVLSLSLIFILSCNNGPIIDLSHYEDSLHIDDLDSTYMLSEGSVNGRRTVFLNIHCTASRENQDLRGDWFLNFFKNERGWSKPGYNEIVELSGNRFLSVPYDLDGYTTWDEVSYGVRGYNSVSINISYVGGVDKYLRPKDTRTIGQIRAIDEIVHEIKCAIPDIIIRGHTEHPNVNKACPSFSVDSEYGKLNPVFNGTEEFDYNPDEEYKISIDSLDSLN